MNLYFLHSNNSRHQHKQIWENLFIDKVQKEFFLITNILTINCIKLAKAQIWYQLNISNF